MLALTCIFDKTAKEFSAKSYSGFKGFSGWNFMVLKKQISMQNKNTENTKFSVWQNNCI